MNDEDSKPLEDLKPLAEKIRREAHATAKDLLLRTAQELDKNIAEYVTGLIRKAVCVVLGVETPWGDRIKEGSALEQKLRPHVERIADEWIKEYVKKPLPPRVVDHMKLKFHEGYQNAVGGIAWKVGKEVGEKHALEVRKALLGVVEVTEETLTGTLPDSFKKAV